MNRLLLNTLFTLVVSVGLSSVEAKDCHYINQRQNLGPARNQGNIGWCYANATADLLTHEYRSELQGRSVSATYVALAYNQDYFQIPLFEGGFVFMALHSAQSNGFCPREVEDQMRNQGLPQNLKEKLQYLQAWKQFYDQKGTTSLDQFFIQIKTINSSLTQIPRREMEYIFENSSKKNFLKMIADRLCIGKKVRVDQKRKVKFYSTYFLDSEEKMVRIIDQQLDRQNIVGLAYYSSFFESWTAKLSGSDRHESVVVGRRPGTDPNSCEYLIRNSYGNQCTSYKNTDLISAANCEEGHFWISEKNLEKYMYGITFFAH